jgi:hypothetical protein
MCVRDYIIFDRPEISNTIDNMKDIWQLVNAVLDTILALPDSETNDDNGNKKKRKQPEKMAVINRKKKELSDGMKAHLEQCSDFISEATALVHQYRDQQKNNKSAGLAGYIPIFQWLQKRATIERVVIEPPVIIITEDKSTDKKKKGGKHQKPRYPKLRQFTLIPVCQLKPVHFNVTTTTASALVVTTRNALLPKPPPADASEPPKKKPSESPEQIAIRMELKRQCKIFLPIFPEDGPERPKKVHEWMDLMFDFKSVTTTQTEDTEQISNSVIAEALPPVTAAGPTKKKEFQYSFSTNGVMASVRYGRYFQGRTEKERAARKKAAEANDNSTAELAMEKSAEETAKELMLKEMTMFTADLELAAIQKGTPLDEFKEKILKNEIRTGGLDPGVCALYEVVYDTFSGLEGVRMSNKTFQHLSGLPQQRFQHEKEIGKKGVFFDIQAIWDNQPSLKHPDTINVGVEYWFRHLAREVEHGLRAQLNVRKFNRHRLRQKTLDEVCKIISKNDKPDPKLADMVIFYGDARFDVCSRGHHPGIGGARLRRNLNRYCQTVRTGEYNTSKNAFCCGEEVEGMTRKVSIAEQNAQNLRKGLLMLTDTEKGRRNSKTQIRQTLRKERTISAAENKIPLLTIKKEEKGSNSFNVVRKKTKEKVAKREEKRILRKERRQEQLQQARTLFLPTEGEERAQTKEEKKVVRDWLEKDVKERLEKVLAELNVTCLGNEKALKKLKKLQPAEKEKKFKVHGVRVHVCKCSAWIERMNAKEEEHTCSSSSGDCTMEEASDAEINMDCDNNHKNIINKNNWKFGLVSFMVLWRGACVVFF